MSDSTAADLRRKAQQILDWPLVETTIEDGKTVIKPAKWTLADASKLLELAQELEATEGAKLDDPFDAPPNLPGQVESRVAYGALQALAGKTPWWDDYLRLRAELNEAGKPKWNWREALYMAWASLPKRLRWPRTQEDLARQVLGLTNDRTIRDWKTKRPEMEERIARLTGDSLMRYRTEVLDALVQVAAMPDPKAFSDRRLFLEMSGDYKPRQALDHSGQIASVEMTLSEWRELQEQQQGQVKQMMADFEEDDSFQAGAISDRQSEPSGGGPG